MGADPRPSGARIPSTSRAPAVSARSAMISLSTSASASSSFGIRTTTSSPSASVRSAASKRPEPPAVSRRACRISASDRAAEAAAARVRGDRAMPPRLGRQPRAHATPRPAGRESMTLPAHVGAFDISADERAIPDLVATLLREPSTRALLVRGDRARIADGGLVFSPVDEAPDGTTWAFLGRTGDGAALLLGALPAAEAGDDDTGWTSFRDVGAVLDRADADLLVAGIALGRWLVDSGFCPTCGTAAPLSTAGWARHCPTCDRELFPRTDPAVIVAIVSQDGERLLLGANAAWGGAMFSCFAGFVEAGESAERAIHRELREEAGVRVTDLRYVESQAGPFPRSPMLRFHATR